jgi:hypothetical protein
MRRRELDSGSWERTDVLLIFSDTILLLRRLANQPNADKPRWRFDLGCRDYMVGSLGVRWNQNGATVQ